MFEALRRPQPTTTSPHEAKGKEQHGGSVNFFAAAINKIVEVGNTLLTSRKLQENEVNEILNQLTGEYNLRSKTTLTNTCSNSTEIIKKNIRRILKSKEIPNTEKLDFANKILAHIESIDEYLDLTNDNGNESLLVIYCEARFAFISLFRIVWIENEKEVNISRKQNTLYQTNRENLESENNQDFIKLLEDFHTVTIRVGHNQELVIKLEIHRTSTAFYVYFIHELLYAIFQEDDNQDRITNFKKHVGCNIYDIAIKLFGENLEENQDEIIKDLESLIEKFKIKSLPRDQWGQELTMCERRKKTELWVGFFMENSPYMSYAFIKIMKEFNIFVITTSDQTLTTATIGEVTYTVIKKRDLVKNGDCALWAVLSATEDKLDDVEHAEEQAAQFRNSVIEAAVAHMALAITKSYTGPCTPIFINKSTEFIRTIFGKNKEYFMAYMHLQINDRLNTLKMEFSNQPNNKEAKVNVENCEKDLENAKKLFSDIPQNTTTANNWAPLKESLIKLFFKYMPEVDGQEMCKNVMVENIKNYEIQAKIKYKYLTNNEIAVAMLMRGYIAAGFVCDSSGAQILTFKKLLVDGHTSTADMRYIKCIGAEGAGTGTSTPGNVAIGQHWVHVELAPAVK